MIDQRTNAPRRYFVDAQGHRVLIGLSLEETVEFELLESAPGPGECATAAQTAQAPSETRWLQLYTKHDEAWKAWIAQGRVERRV